MRRCIGRSSIDCCLQCARSQRTAENYFKHKDKTGKKDPRALKIDEIYFKHISNLSRVTKSVDSIHMGSDTLINSLIFMSSLIKMHPYNYMLL